MDDAELKGKLYPEWTTPLTQITFRIKRVRLRRFIVEMGGLPVGPTDSVGKQLENFGDDLRKRFEDPEEEMKTIRFFLSNGVVSPKIWIGNESECPDGQVPVDALGSDADWLSGKVAELSFGYEEVRSYDRFFPGGEPDHPGLGSEEVRDDPVGAGEPRNAEPVVQHERGPEGDDGGDRGEPEAEPAEGADRLAQ